MKKVYITPETIVTHYYGDIVMSAASPESHREVDGGPTEDGLPGTVGETDGNLDPYGGHGQGTGGEGNRAKEMDVWAWDW